MSHKLIQQALDLANTALDVATTTATEVQNVCLCNNRDCLPSIDDTFNLGNDSYRWLHVGTDSLTTTGQVSLNSNVTAATAIDLNASSKTGSGITMAANSGGVTVTSSGNVSVTASNPATISLTSVSSSASAINLNASNAGGGITISAGSSGIVMSSPLGGVSIDNASGLYLTGPLTAPVVPVNSVNPSFGSNTIGGGGSVVVSGTSATGSSLIFLTYDTGVHGTQALSYGSSGSGSFTVYGDAGSGFVWMIVN